MKQDLYSMFRWSIRTAMDKHPNSMINLWTIKKIIDRVWNDMVDDGEIIFPDKD